MEIAKKHQSNIVDCRDVDRFESAMSQLPPVIIEPVHHFAPGIYAREITIPAGTLLTGKIHKTEHLCMILQGDISVWSQDTGMRRIQAPFTMVSQPGTRRVAYAHSDTVWTTIHPRNDDERDPEKLESELIVPYANPLLAADSGDRQIEGEHS